MKAVTGFVKVLGCALGIAGLTLTGCEQSPPEVPEAEQPETTTAPEPTQQAPAGETDVAAEAKAEAEKTVTAENAEEVLDALAKEIEAEVAQ